MFCQDESFAYCVFYYFFLKSRIGIYSKMGSDIDNQGDKKMMGDTDLQIESLYANQHKLILKNEILEYELRQIFNNSIDETWIIDTDYNVIRVNQRMQALLKKPESEILGKKCYDLLDLDICRKQKCPLKNANAPGQMMEVSRKIKADEVSFNYILSATPFFGFSNELIGFIESLKDITKRKVLERKLKLANRELKKISVLDGLTQIYNRRYFDKILPQEFNRCKRKKEHLSLMMIDIDYFKFYNDSYGHMAGDNCLKTVAQIISNSINRASDIAVRYGGEEFAVVLPNTPIDGAVTVARRIQETLMHRRIEHKSSKISQFLTVSIGIQSAIPTSDLAIDDIIQRADLALYEAKSRGRSRYHLFQKS